MWQSRGRASGRSRAQEEWEVDKRLMAALDARTEIPHLLVELRSLGYVEICGKDLGGIHRRLEEWMYEVWGCEHMTTELVKRPDPHAFSYPEEGWTEGFMVQHQHLEEWDRLCDDSFHWLPNRLVCRCMPCCGTRTVTVFKMRGDSGENNMGKLTMQLIDFMTNTCGWGLKLLNGTNLGFYGHIREQQVKFKAPHPLNLIAPHIMIELRQAGYIEINGPNRNGIYEKLETWFKDNWKAKRVKADPEYCDLKFRCSAFKNRGGEGENNMGMRTMEIVDFMVQKCVWTMITCNGGNYGRYGDVREQQMVFRDDEHVQHGEDHIMVELRDVGYVEVNGLTSSGDIAPHIDRFLREYWGCKEYEPGFWERDKFCDKKYTTPKDLYYKDGLTNNIGKLTVELAMSLATQGWMLMLCNGGHTSTLKSRANTTNFNTMPGQVISEVRGGIKREQQVKFTKARPGETTTEPLLMIELRSVPKDPPSGIQAPGVDMFRSKHETARLNKELSRSVRDWIARGEYQGLIEVNGFNTNGVYQKLEAFIKQNMKGKAFGPTPYCDCLFTCDAFRQKMHYESEYWDGYYCGENNFGKYTMRLCDYLVDHLGEWDLIVCNGNSAERAWMFGGMTSLVSREQQMIFRHRPRGRAVFMSAALQDAPLGRPPFQAPDYWKDGSREGLSPHEVLPTTPEELRWAQELLDGTYLKRVTRDRRGGALADRFVVVAAVRSEHAKLWDAFAKRRASVGEHIAAQSGGTVCKFWARGHCKHGSGCKYPHRGPGGEVAAALRLVEPRTAKACPGLAARCCLPGGGNPSQEAYFMHGTNPTSAVAILRTDFKIDLAGASAGTMFGPGAYLAESSSKADEYAQEDKDGAYKGLYAMLICRGVTGRPFAVEAPGDHSKRVLSGEFDCVLGDRERAVGTYREFIFFHEESIFPEYAVFYRREYDAAEAVAGEGGAPRPSSPGGGAPAGAPGAGRAEAVPGRAPREWQVLLPGGSKVGQAFEFTKPDGQVVRATVPPGSRPGGIVTITMAA